jgi:hypothetical protein
MDCSLRANDELPSDAASTLCCGLIHAFRTILADRLMDAASKALVLSLPTANELIYLIPRCNPHILHQVYELLIASLARELRPELEAVISDSGCASRFVYISNIIAIRLMFCN